MSLSVLSCSLDIVIINITVSLCIALHGFHYAEKYSGNITFVKSLYFDTLNRNSIISNCLFSVFISSCSFLESYAQYISFFSESGEKFQMVKSFNSAEKGHSCLPSFLASWWSYFTVQHRSRDCLKHTRWKTVSIYAIIDWTTLTLYPLTSLVLSRLVRVLFVERKWGERKWEAREELWEGLQPCKSKCFTEYTPLHSANPLRFLCSLQTRLDLSLGDTLS